MKTKEQVLETQRCHGHFDATQGNSYGHSNEDTAYPNTLHRDITRQEAFTSYQAGWDKGRKPKPAAAKEITQ